MSLPDFIYVTPLTTPRSIILVCRIRLPRIPTGLSCSTWYRSRTSYIHWQI